MADPSTADWVRDPSLATRVDGMEDVLRLLAARGYAPRVVIDCGANVGQWLDVADRVFPGTSCHAIAAPWPVIQLMSMRRPGPQ